MKTLTKTGIKLLSKLYKSVLFRSYKSGQAIVAGAVLGSVILTPATSHAAAPIDIKDFINGTNGVDDTYTTFSASGDIIVSTAAELGTTARSGSLRELALELNDYDLIGYNNSKNHNGITVTAGYTLNVEGTGPDSLITGFNNAFINDAGGTLKLTGLKFTNNNVSVMNNGTLNIGGNVTFDEGYIDGNGVTNITGNNVIFEHGVVIDQDKLYLTNVNAGLTINANNVLVNTFQNEGKITFTGGTLDQDLTGISGDVIIANGTIFTGNVIQDRLAIADGETLTNNGDTTFRYITLDAGEKIEGTGNLTIAVNGGVINNGSITQNNLTIGDNVTFTNNGALNITGALTNNGIFQAKVDNEVDVSGSGVFRITDGIDIQNTGFISNNISISNGGTLTTNADDIGNITYVNGTLDLTGGTLAHNVDVTSGTTNITSGSTVVLNSGNTIKTNVNILNHATLITDIDTVNAINDFNSLGNEGNLIVENSSNALKTVTKDIMGTGDVTINGQNIIFNNSNIENNIIVNSSGTAYLQNSTFDKDIVNNGYLTFTDYSSELILDKDISGSGSVFINTDTTLSAGSTISSFGLDVTNSTFTNNGVINSSSMILGNATMINNGTMGAATVNIGGTLNTSLEDAGFIMNFGRLEVTNDSINETILGASGTTVLFSENATYLGSSANIQGTLDLNGKTITLSEAAESTTDPAREIGSLTGTGNLQIDADLTAGLTNYDKINITNGGDANLTLSNINITTEGDLDNIEYLLGNLGSITTSVLGGEIITTTATHKYTFTQSATGQLTVERIASSTGLTDWIRGLNGNDASFTSFSTNSDMLVMEPGDLGTLHRDNATDTTYTLNLNNGANLSGYGSSNEYNGIAVNENDVGYDLKIAGTTGSEISGFNKALIVNENSLAYVENIAFNNNNQDIVNNGIVDLSGVNNITNGIHGYGRTVIFEGQTTANEINQGGLAILSKGQLTINADDLNIGSDINNSGKLSLTGGTFDTALGGDGELNIAENTTNAANVYQELLSIEDGKTLTNNGNIYALFDLGVGQTIDGNGALFINSGNSGTTSATNAGTITQSAVVISEKYTLNNTGSITADIINDGKFNTSGNNANTITGTGTLDITGTNTGNITQHLVKVQYGPFTNNGTITGAIENTHAFEGTGTLNIIGDSYSNTGLIQGTVNVAGGVRFLGHGAATIGSLNNYGIFGIANTELTGVSYNYGEIVSDNSLTIVSGASLTNYGTITTTDITNEGTFTSTNGNFENINLTNNGIFNINSDTFIGNILGTGTTNINTHVKFDESAIVGQNQFNVTQSGILDIGTGHVILHSPTKIEGGLAIELTDISEGSNMHSGGSLKIIGGLNLDSDTSKLMLTVAENKLAKHTSTGDILLIDADLIIGDFASMLSNNRYEVTKGSTDGTYVLTYNADIKDVVNNAGGTSNNIAVGTIWDNATGLTGDAQNVASQLNSLSQHDEKGYVTALNAIAPNDSQKVTQSFRNMAGLMTNEIAQRQNTEFTTDASKFYENGSTWAAILGRFSNKGNTDKSYGFTTTDAGMAFGFDKKITPDVLVGFAYGYNSGSIDNDVSETEATGHSLYAYAKYKSADMWHIRGALGMSFASFEEETNASGVSKTADFDANNLNLTAFAGYDMGNGWTPEFGLQLMNVSHGDYTDSLGQEISTDNATILTTTLATDYQTDWFIMDGKYNLNPIARMGISYDILSNDTNSVVNFNGSNYAITGEALNPFAIELSIGLETEIKAWTFGISYDFEGRPDFSSHGGTFKARYQF